MAVHTFSEAEGEKAFTGIVLVIASIDRVPSDVG
jgi:hypothetical protein